MYKAKSGLIAGKGWCCFVTPSFKLAVQQNYNYINVKNQYIIHKNLKFFQSCTKTKMTCM